MANTLALLAGPRASIADGCPRMPLDALGSPRVCRALPVNEISIIDASGPSAGTIKTIVISLA